MKKQILSYFKKHPTSGIKIKVIAAKLGVTEFHEYEKLKAVLFQLVEEGILVRKGKRYLLHQTQTTGLTGKLVMGENANYGFVILDNSNLNDIFIPGRHLNCAFNGDKVEINILAKKKGKNLEGEITKVLSRKRNELVGTLSKSKSFYFVIPDDPTIHRDIYIPRKEKSNAKNGDKVVVGNLEWTDPQLNPEGKILKVIGKAGSYETDLISIATEFNFSYDFPDGVKAEVKNIELDINEHELKSRLDYRSKNVFTIDPDDAKDYDDALSIIKLKNGNFEIGIHIADVSHYIDIDSELYNEALNRATSVYLVGKVIPMLPEKLSNKICSLVPDEDRLTYSVLVEMTPRGRIVNYQIIKSVINSKKRFTYNEAQEVLDNKKGIFFDQLFQLNKLAQNLRNKRIRKGSINFHSNEVKFILDDKGKITKVQKKETLETNKLVEEFMLLANQIVCSHIDKNKGNFPFIYRIHDLPDKDKIREFSKFVSTLGFKFAFSAQNQSKSLQTLLEDVKGTPEENIINEVAIRSMAKAIYSNINSGHFGLGFKHYTHFTSPIRRFPDLLVHKLLYDYTTNNKKTQFREKQVEYICDHSSKQERNAIEAERLSVKLKQIEFLSSKLGEEFTGIISGVTNFGIFVQLEESLAEGLIKIGDLDDDFYIYDEKQYALKGRTSKKVYRLGDKINVKIVRIDKQKREIDFIVVE